MKDVIDQAIDNLYSGETVPDEPRQRLEKLLEIFKQKFGDEPTLFVSAPGRTELGGNHTDHNNGKVLAASVTLDSIAWVRPTADNRVKLFSEGFSEPFILNLFEIDIVESEVGTTTALVRGIAARLSELGHIFGGFDATITSNILIGSGLSSSASIEILIASIFNILYNGGTISPAELAEVGRFAENQYFGKPCGLMDQLACVVGGIIGIDFKDSMQPNITRLSEDISADDYRLIIVNTGGSHADLTPEYAAISDEMKAVSKALGKETLGEIDASTIHDNIEDLRRQVGDRAILRAEHFFMENRRVEDQIEALRLNDFEAFLRLMKESGSSSYRWLQNIYSTSNPRRQSVALALLLSEQFIEKAGAGAVRVHGGGFAGTIQLFLRGDHCRDYRQWMRPLIGDDAIIEMQIRDVGVWHAWLSSDPET